MERHLLVTVSEHPRYFYGVHFMGHFFKNKKDLKLTLFYTAPRPPAVWEGERTFEDMQRRESYAKEYEKKGRRALEAAGRELARAGYRETHLVSHLQVRMFSKAMDIVQEGVKGLYDAVVLGRRGVSWLEEVFDESVSKAVVNKGPQFPIWICRKPDPARQGVLVCLDGSESSFRVADHVGFIIAREKAHRTMILVIHKPGAKLPKDPEEILAEGRMHLTRNGFPDEMIDTTVLKASNVSRAILNTAEKGRFAAVAMGRTGCGKGFLKRIFMGSVSSRLFKEMEKAALWICH